MKSRIETYRKGMTMEEQRIRLATNNAVQVMMRRGEFNENTLRNFLMNHVAGLTVNGKEILPAGMWDYETCVNVYNEFTC